MDIIQEMELVGHYHFLSKDKTKEYFVVQAMSSLKDASSGNIKANIIDIFVSGEVYKNISSQDIGSVINVQIVPNLSTGKLNFKICL